MDDYKDMTVITTKEFHFNDGEDWYYKVAAYADVTSIEYYEGGLCKDSMEIPTFVAAKMLNVIADMAKEAEE